MEHDNLKPGLVAEITTVVDDSFSGETHGW